MKFGLGIFFFENKVKNCVLAKSMEKNVFFEDAGSIEKNMSPLQRFFFEIFFLNKNKNTYFLGGSNFFFFA